MTATIDQNNSIINALKRLERAGSDASHGTQKLIASAREAGDKIEAKIIQAGLIGEELPRGYRVDWQDHTCPGCRDTIEVSALTRPWAGDYVAVNSTGVLPETQGCGDFNCSPAMGWPRTTRYTALAFAQDLADGLFDEIAAFIEERTGEVQRATEQIQAALESAHSKLSAMP